MGEEESKERESKDKRTARRRACAPVDEEQTGRSFAGPQ